jgi:tRNA-dihydrouridine synthase B
VAARTPWKRPRVSLPRHAGPELIDINYGCPVHKVVNKGAGACLLQDVDKMVRLTEKLW